MVDKEKLMTVMRNVVNLISEVDAYSWSDGFSRKHVKDSLGRLREWLGKEKIDWQNLSEDDLKVYGFKAWDEPDEEGNVVMLIPLYLLSVIPAGTVLQGIGGDTVTVGKDEIDNDVRFGCIAYGLKVKAGDEGVEGGTVK